MKSTLHTLVFDLDGTLSDPAEGIIRSTNHALASDGFPEAPDAAIRSLIGPPLDLMFKTLIPGIDPERIARLVGKYRERYAVTGYAENRLYNGIPEMMNGLRSRGYRLGVCTSKRQDFAEKILALFRLRRLCAFVSGGDIGVSKADQIASLLRQGTIPDESIMIGDRAVDVLAGKQNRLKSAGVLWGFGSPSEIRDAQPDFIFENPAQIESAFARTSG